MEFVVRCRLGLRVELALPGISHLPRRRTPRRRKARGPRGLARVREDFAHGHSLVDEGDDANLAAALGARQWENEVSVQASARSAFCRG
jgi:hypothetical protein